MKTLPSAVTGLHGDTVEGFKNITAISGCAEAILFYASFAVVNRPYTPPT